MKVFVFLVISFICVSCATNKKNSHYDSVFKKNHHSSKKDIVDTLRSVASLDKDDFIFISEKMKNVVESYKALQTKISKLDKKINYLVKKTSERSNKKTSDIQILTEEVPDEALHFTSEVSGNTPVQAPVNANSDKESQPQENQKGDQASLVFVEAKKLYYEKSWQSAISKFQDYRDKQPKGPYVIEATYYMGESFRYLKMLPEARVFYKEIMKLYPTSSWAFKAKQQLKNK